MADFFNTGWGVAIAVVVILSMLFCLILLWSQSKMKVKLGSDGKPLPPGTTGHVWDEDLTEHNNPLPRWWMWLFYITVFFSFGYLVLYPGLGSNAGMFAWSGVGQYEEEVKKGEIEVAPLFAKYEKMDVPTVAQYKEAREIGQRIFLNNCAQCHGSDGYGGRGFPNLTDKDWLYGGSPDKIEETIREGRHGIMPPMGAALGGEKDVLNVAHYVLSLSGSTHDPIKAALGKGKFGVCAACHGVDGKGNQALGAPNLTDKIWLHGGELDTVVEVITKGLSNQMPAQKEYLSPAKIHVLTGYVWSLSHPIGEVNSVLKDAALINQQVSKTGKE